MGSNKDDLKIDDGIGIKLFSRSPGKQTSEGSQLTALVSPELQRRKGQFVSLDKCTPSAGFHAEKPTGIRIKSTGDKALEGRSARRLENLGRKTGKDVDKCDDEEGTKEFGELGLSQWMVKVCHSLGMNKPTKVQTGCIPAVMEGRDVIGVAHTGSGKTAAFALPILQRLSADPYGVFALVMTPTRELAFQIADQFRALGAGSSLKQSVVVGGLDAQVQAKELSRRPHVVVATPGRLGQLLEGDSSLARIFSRCAFLVLDEADRLLEPCFEADLGTILQTLPDKRQTLLFSATMTRSLIELQTSLLQNAFYFKAYEGLQTAGSHLKEQYLLVPAKVKEVYLIYILNTLKEFNVRSAIVFSSTCRGCALLAALLQELEIASTSLHSGLPQKRRLASLDRFRSGIVPILLATDVAARGLDIPTVDLVINFDLPILARDYVHRVGRTARANRAGWSLSFVSQYDVELVQRIEALTGKQMSQFEVEESEALKGITKVYSARRAAIMQISDERQRRGDNNRKRKVEER